MKRFVHILIAIAELIPILSQIASIFEMLIVKACLNKSANSQPPQNLLNRRISVEEGNQSQATHHNTSTLNLDEDKKNLATRKIQSAYRSHKLKLHGKENDLKSESSKEEKSKSEPYVNQSGKTPNVSLEKFTKYSLSLALSDNKKQHIEIQSFSDLDTMLLTTFERIKKCHEWTIVDFNSYSESETITKMNSFQQSESAKHLKFQISDRRIIIQLQPLEDLLLEDGNTRRTYINGVTEIMKPESYYIYGTRIYSDGTKEQGKFQKELNTFFSGYRKHPDSSIEFRNPSPLAFYQIDSSHEQIQIIEVEGKLIVLKQTEINREKQYVTSDISVYQALFNSSLKNEYDQDKSIEAVLLHKSFEADKESFIKESLSLDESGIPKIFGFSSLSALELLEAASKNADFDLLKIVDNTGKNIFIHFVDIGDLKKLTKLIDLFPKAFKSSGQAAIAQWLQRGYNSHSAQKLAEKLSSLGGALDEFPSLLMSVALHTPPDEGFKKQFSVLSATQKRELYEAAYTYNNSFLCEPTEQPVRADQYSINLMWINKNKIPVTQEFLCGDGFYPENIRSDFHTRFVIPVSKWAKANPGSPINIWVDSEMATPGAIERSYEALQKELGETPQKTIKFRDVRSLDLVRSNPQVFSEKMAFHFRVDLLRAIAANHTLKNKETQFFVYGDNKMEPLAGQEIFDKRTMDYLNDYGFVMAKGGSIGFKNGFQILNGENSQLVESHRTVIIDLNIEMALENTNQIDEQQIYDTHKAMITHFLAADGRFGKLEIPYQRDEEDVPEDQILTRFRFDKFKMSFEDGLPLGDGKTLIQNIMPRKPVRLPLFDFS